MEVLKGEFEVMLPSIREALKEADFIAIDAEFTGLKPPDVSYHTQDDPQTRYTKVCESVRTYTVIQYGVCAFKTTHEGVKAKPFNFYIFPNESDDFRSTRSFVSDASSLVFLANNQFDFNKMVRCGIPYCNHSEQAATVANVMGNTAMLRRDRVDMNKLSRQQRSFVENWRTQIEAWLLQGTGSLIVPCNSAMHRRLICQEIQDPQYNGFLQAIPRDTKNIEIKKITAEERVRSNLGDSPVLNFRHIIDAIKDADCPVIVHNGMYDLCHTVDQFWHNLPQDLNEFKSIASGMWNTIIDTKYLAELHPKISACFNTSVLGTLYVTVEDELRREGHNISMADGFDRYNNNTLSQHEAGYDAYMTGVIFLGFVHYVLEVEEKERRIKGEPSPKIDPDTPMILNPSLLPYYNKIFQMRASIPYLDLTGIESEDLVQRNRFFVRQLPEKLAFPALERLLPELTPFYVSWGDESTAWLTVRDPAKVELVKLGALGLDRVKPFLPGGNRAIEGEAYYINSDAAKIELLSGEQWVQWKEQTKAETKEQVSRLDDIEAAMEPSTGINGISGNDTPAAAQATATTEKDTSTADAPMDAETPAKRPAAPVDDLGFPIPSSFAGSKRQKKSKKN
ncbi:CAF1 family ribonuclease-domain-containing protein [Gongronella butleri]|nr:CAF1 family ribonuclease-domain-containing protein [Gongronella butleri]